jgi:hypothetical protein
MSFRHLVNAANAASFGWQLSGSRTYLAAQVPAGHVSSWPERDVPLARAIGKTRLRWKPHDIRDGCSDCIQEKLPG